MADRNQPIAFKELQEKISKFKKEGGVDLSTAEDLSVAVMNLISLSGRAFLFHRGELKDSSNYDFSEEIGHNEENSSPEAYAGE